MAWLGIDRFGLSLARRLLSIWVKANVIPEDLAAIGIDSEQPVFFVIETPSLANVLVVEQECLRRGLPWPTGSLDLGSEVLPRRVAAVVRFHGVWRRRPSARYSATLRALIEAARSDLALNIQLIPIAVFFGREPDQESSGFKILFSDSETHVGRIRKFFVVLLHGRNTWVQFAAPVSLREFVDQQSGTTSDQAVRKLSRVFRVHFRQLRTAAIGPDLSQRQVLVDRLMQDPSVMRAVAEEAKEQHISPAKASRRARRYAYEISANLSYPFLLFMRRVLRRLWNKLYDGVEVHHVETLQRVAPGHTVVYLPCHRSHIDYLLLSYVLHQHGLAVPHIAAGINLNLPLIGPLLRRGGAFFLRRTFRGQRLYGLVFHAYLSAILAKGFSVEYFVEGTRSRSGFSLAAKPGMLDMTVRSFLAQRNRPIVFVPVYIGYEKLVEGRSYLAELSGGRKRKESLFGFFSSLRALRSQFGKVHLNFGEPIALAEWLDSQHPDWREQSADAKLLEQRPEWLPPVVAELGREVMTRINSAVDINAVNLLALVLVATPRRAMAELELIDQIAVLRKLLARAPYAPTVTVTELDPRAIIEQGIKLGAIQREPHPLGAIIAATGDNTALLSYYSNNVLNTFALPGLVACCFENVEAMTLEQITRLSGLVYPFLRAELFLPWSDDALAEAVCKVTTTLVELRLLERAGQDLRRPPADAPEARRLTLLSRCVLQTVERFFLVITLLVRRGSWNLTTEELGQTCYLLGQRLAKLYAFRTPDFADERLFASVIETLQSMGLIRRNRDHRIIFDADFSALYSDAADMLAEPIRRDIVLVTRGAEDAQFVAKAQPGKRS